MNIMLDIFILSLLIAVEVIVLKKIWNVNNEAVIPLFYYEKTEKRCLNANNHDDMVVFENNQINKNVDNCLLVNSQNNLKSKYEGEQYYTFK